MTELYHATALGLVRSTVPKLKNTVPLWSINGSPLSFYQNNQGGGGEDTAKGETLCTRNDGPRCARCALPPLVTDLDQVARLGGLLEEVAVKVRLVLCHGVGQVRVDVRQNLVAREGGNRERVRG